MLLFMQSRQVGFALSTTKLKQNKEEEIYNLCDHQKSAIDLVLLT